MSSTGRTRLQVLAAGILAVGGGSAIFYAGLLPLPPISDRPVPLAWLGYGVLGLAAGVGVFTGRPWGRALGVAVAAVAIVLAVFRAGATGPGSSLVGLIAGSALSAILDIVVLWVLLRHWPAHAGDRTGVG